MTDKFAVGIGPFSGQINAGLVDSTGKGFKSKQDCTDQALIATSIYVLRNGGEITVTDDFGNKVRLHAEFA
ncbi:hypothetical protein [Mycobacterium phage WXIN]|nr:hypothetical protein [Mycobacterium phage WXIN]